MCDSATAPNVLCIGFGALGTIYSYLLKCGGAKITAVARSNYDTLRTDGILISSAKYGKIEGWKPDRVIRESEPEQAKDIVYDYVVCTFKNIPDLKAASAVIKPFLAQPTDSSARLPTIVLIQNGVGIEEEVQKALVECETPLAGHVISAVAWIGANLTEGGKRVDHGSLERLEIGIYGRTTAPIAQNGLRQKSEEETRALKQFADLYTQGGGGGAIVDDIEAIRWQKVLWNASWGGLSTLARLPVATLLQEETLHYSVGVVRRIMLEIMYVARSCGIGEDRFPSSAIDKAFELSLLSSPVKGVHDPSKGASISPDFKPSILLDLENGRPMELEPIIGNIVAKARLTNTDTPRLDLILAALKINQVKAIAAATTVAPSADSERQNVTTFGQLTATSRGNWPAGAPVSQNPTTYL